MIAGFLNTVVLLGALQGFIVSGLMVASVRQRPAERASRRLLAFIILLIAFACLDIYLEHCDFWMSTTMGSILSAVLPLIIVMPVGPLFYFYIRSCVEPDFRMGRRERRHFYPVVVDLFQHFAALCFIIGLLTGVLSNRHEYHFGVFLDDYNQYSDIPRWVSLTIYLVLATRYMRKRRDAGLDGVGGLDGAGGKGRVASAPVRFLRVFWAFDIFWLLFLIPYELPRIGDELIARVDWYPLYLPLVAIIYYLGVKGYFITYRREGGLGGRSEGGLGGRSGDGLGGRSGDGLGGRSGDGLGGRSEGGIGSSRESGPGGVLGAAIAADEKKGGIAIPEERLGQLILALKKAMEEERLWLNADLNLGRLAQHCGAAPKLLSAVLNQHMNTTFNEFVNGYRIDAVKVKILRPESRELTIAGLAYECGFNSLPTFQRAFKALTGMSPKEYMAGHASTLPNEI